MVIDAAILFYYVICILGKKERTLTTQLTITETGIKLNFFTFNARKRLYFISVSSCVSSAEQ